MAGREEDGRAADQPIGPESDADLRDIFEAVLAAEDPAAGQDGDGKKSERNFTRKDVGDFLDVIRRNPSAASVCAYNDFEYTANRTTSKIEREYWLWLSRDALPDAQQALAGRDGYAFCTTPGRGWNRRARATEARSRKSTFGTPGTAAKVRFSASGKSARIWTSGGKGGGCLS